jgi:hypothetical protein
MESAKSHRQTGSGADHAPDCQAMDVVSEALGRLRFGTVQLTIHDGKVVQVEVTERRHFS